MNPDEPLPNPTPGRLTRAHDAVDRIYQGLTRPDMPLTAEAGKRPWLAALLSFFLAGGGQIYNRQLGKAVLLFFLVYIVGTVVLVTVLLLMQVPQLHDNLQSLPGPLLLLWTGLWLFGIFDAYRTASLLRSGKLLVRYGLRRQGIHAVVSWLPFVGALVPAETVTQEELNQKVGQVLTELAKQRALTWLVVRLLRFGLLATGAVLLLLAAVVGSKVTATIAALVLLAGLFLFLV